MLVRGLTQATILSELKKHFTDDELDEIGPDKLSEFISESDTLEDLIDTLEDYFAD